VSHPFQHPHGNQNVLRAGTPLEEASGLVILLHGRGAAAAGMLQLALQLAPESGDGPRLAFAAPQASGVTWYPFPFSAPVAENEPYLSSALRRIDELVDEAVEAGLHPRQVALVGFSQGASLGMEYVAQGRRQIGALAAFAGGLIGGDLDSREPGSSLAGTRVFVGVGEQDQLLPPPIVEQSARLLEAAGANLDFRVYPGVGHAITADEIDATRDLVGTLPLIGPVS
jgi:predicted esterase